MNHTPTSRLRALADELDDARNGKATRPVSEIQHDIILEVSARRARCVESQPNDVVRGVAAYRKERP